MIMQERRTRNRKHPFESKYSEFYNNSRGTASGVEQGVEHVSVYPILELVGSLGSWAKKLRI
jgi:hypothetical protein